MRARRASLVPTETEECIAFVDWTKLVRYQGLPLFDRLVKIPNERGKSGVMVAVLVRIGMRKGFPDYLLLVPTPLANGLLIEAKKTKGGRVSPEQEVWRSNLREWGYAAAICEGADEMIAVVRAHMAQTLPGNFVDRTHLDTDRQFAEDTQ